MPTWRCRCPICRLLVHPVINRVRGSGATAEGGEYSGAQPTSNFPSGAEEVIQQPTPMEKSSEVAAVSATEGIATTSEQAASISVDEIVGKLVDAVSSTLTEHQKLLAERLDRLEESIGKVSVELRNVVDSMQQVLIELRELVSEASNPFVGEQSFSTSGVHNPKQRKLVKVLANIVSKLGLENFENLLNECVRSGALSIEKANQLRAMAHMVAALVKSGLDVNDVSMLLEVMLHAPRNGNSGS